MAASIPPSPFDDRPNFDLNLQHGHKDLVLAVAFNTYGDRCATGSVDGKIRVFNRHKDGIWRLCDNWSAHGGEVLEVGSITQGILADHGQLC
jgi:nucleoporin SEH1